MLTSQRLDRLRAHAERIGTRSLRSLADEAGRADAWSLDVGPLHFNYARQRVDDPALAELLELARSTDVCGALKRQFDGDVVNPSEQRAALHTALRSNIGDGAAARSARAQACDARIRMRQLTSVLAGSEVTDIVHVGIGGSDLGPRLVVDALKQPGARFRVHFISNMDAHQAQRVLDGLDPKRCAAVLVSKSFGTHETLINGALIRDWLGTRDRCYAVTANTARAESFGIDPSRLLPMWDWVGGRYSLWSAVGFSTLLALGESQFDALLQGAALMDHHARNAAPEKNMAVLHALFALWNRSVRGDSSEAVIAYDQRLAHLPGHLQQLRMESLGKTVGSNGESISHATAPVVWGGVGSSAQHSFFQALHQGSDRIPVEFIGVRHPDHSHLDQHAMLLANLLAQAEALANGSASDCPQRHYPGGSPSSMILLDRLDPESLGALLALYEHSTAILGQLWGINAFDQWGVELGKTLATALEPAVRGDADCRVDDAVTRVLLDRLRRD